MSNEKSKYIGVLASLGATAIWSGNFVVARGLSNELPPVTIAYCRWVVAFLVFTPFMAVKAWKNRDVLLKHWRFIVPCGILGVTIFNTLIYVAGHTTTTLNMSLVSISFPIFMLLIARYFLGERISMTQVFGILVVIIGVLLTITKGDIGILLGLRFYSGDIWMIIAAVLFAIYSILLQKKPKELDKYLFLYGTITVGLLVLTPVFLYERMRYDTISFSQESIYAILYVGIFASLVAYIFWDVAIVQIGSSLAGMVYYTMPIFSGLLGYLILNESISIYHFISAALIVGGILISRIKKRERH